MFCCVDGSDLLDVLRSCRRFLAGIDWNARFLGSSLFTICAFADGSRDKLALCLSSMSSMRGLCFKPMDVLLN